MLSRADIATLHAQYVQPGFGTTTPDELAFIQATIHTYKPRRFIEVGTASGLTTGFIARFMEEVGGGSVTSIDISTRFFGDHRQPVGYLASQIYKGSAVDLRIIPRTTVLDLDGRDGPWDMAFVDADHAHPWPTLDTLTLAPHLSGPRIMLHHDLQLFRRHLVFRGVGPRVLFNETPEAFRHADRANGWNMFQIDLNMPQGTLTEVGANALCMPWTARPQISNRVIEKVCDRFDAEYGSDLAGLLADTARLNRWSVPRRAAFAVRFQLAKLRNAWHGANRP